VINAQPVWRTALLRHKRRSQHTPTSTVVSCSHAVSGSGSLPHTIVPHCRQSGGPLMYSVCALQEDLLEPLRFAARPDLCLVFFTSATSCGSTALADSIMLGPLLDLS